jgi:hypothetical protein
MNIEPTDPRPEDVEVLNDRDDYRRQEMWTDGEWVRIGRDVLGDRYFEVKYERFRDLIEAFRAQQTSVATHSVTDSRPSDETLIVEAGHSLDVYRKRKHVLYHREHEYSVLYTALSKATDARQTFDYEALATSYIESLIPSFWTVRSLTERGRATFSIEVGTEMTGVNFGFIETLREADHADFDEAGHVYFDDDAGVMVYRFRVSADDLPGAPANAE